MCGTLVPKDARPKDVPYYGQVSHGKVVPIHAHETRLRQDGRAQLLHDVVFDLDQPRITEIQAILLGRDAAPTRIDRPVQIAIPNLDVGRLIDVDHRGRFVDEAHILDPTLRRPGELHEAVPASRRTLVVDGEILDSITQRYLVQIVTPPCRWRLATVPRWIREWRGDRHAVG